MGGVIQLPSRNGFNEQERNRIAEVAKNAGAQVHWLKSDEGADWACLTVADDTLGAITREQGKILWFPRDSLFPFLSHVSLEEFLVKVKKLLVPVAKLRVVGGC